MAMYNKISLSPEEKTVKVEIVQQGAVVKTIDVPIRDIEIGMIKSCLNAFCSSGTSDMKQVLSAAEWIDKLENEEGYDHLDFSDQDLDHIKKGYEKLQGNRPDIWVRALQLLRQINDPERIDTMKKATKPSK